MNTRDGKSRVTKVSNFCFYLTGTVFALCLLIIAVSSDSGYYLTMKGVTQIIFAIFLLPAILIITLIGCLLGILSLRKSECKQGKAGALFNLLILLASCWYLWAFHTGLLFRMQSGISKLQCALGNNDVEMVQKELERGKDVNDIFKNGMTPLIQSISQRNKVLFDIIMSHNPNVNCYYDDPGGKSITPLYFVALQNPAYSGSQNRNWNQLEIARVLLERGANPNLRLTYSGNYYGSKNITPLSRAYIDENSDLVDLLLSYGADVNVKIKSSPDGKTLLHVAVEREDIMMVERLISLGAKLDVKSYYTRSDINFPLQKAAQCGNVEIAKLLIDNGADINIREIKGICINSALHISIRHSDIEMMKLLIDKGADINVQGGSIRGMTPLHYAVLLSEGETDCVEFLLEHGADPNIKGRDFKIGITNKSETPLRLASRNKYQDVVDLLISYGAIQEDEK